jgi:ribosomal protein S18 acetylase RimI-like enzyme
VDAMSRFEGIVRELRAEDLPAAIALWQTTEGVGLCAEETPGMLAGFLARNPEISSAALDRSGELIGAVMGGHDGRRGYIYHLAVKPEHRRRGMARALIDRTLQRLAAAGLARVTIMVFTNNDAGRAFWHHAGWNTRVDLTPMQVSFST